MTTSEEIEQVKNQILKQIEDSNIPNKEEAKQQIISMNEGQLEEFLKQNKTFQENKTSGEGCIFCAIISGKIPSFKIDETQEALAVLEINPISKGHLIVIPKTHSEKTQKKSYDLAERLSKKLSQIFQPKKIEIVASSLFGHEIINVFPIYNKETLHSQRNHLEQDDLQELQKQITSFIETPNQTQETNTKELPELTKPKPEIITDKNTWVPKRFP